ncbi:Nucleoside-diphosphate-sugar epimerase [Mariniphaga anaerophila]|uniref:Nucleoside-diphosphate-sugar epimerase n=1 Tax=Mariniphaga anaerophila TaxID=1484053 RepID=A0A1M5BMZ8_9BACT|nr:NAD-dependent epimerase/dehydratase family protein [Mariniphaga anaerophila]SHF43776.1 Nucleoside-diphosphate-sugar epimerase [Mariniphaga anaerophila]
MNILITGAFGFVGTNLSKAIKENSSHKIIAVDIAEPKVHLYDEFFNWKSLGSIDWENTDAVIHLAGKAHDTKNTTDEKHYFDINLGLTQRIFEYFLGSDAKKFIFFSSVKAVADQVFGEKLSETEIPNPQTAYGKSKLAAEQHILGHELTKEKQVYILRPSMIHGPGNKGNLNLLYNMVQKGMPWPLGSFDNQRSFTSIENLSFVVNQILSNNTEPGTYQMADDEVISTNRLIELIAESIGKKPRIWRINKKIIQSAAKLGDVIHLPLNTERLKKLTESYVVSNQKIKNALGIEQMPVAAEAGMKKTLNSFR